MYGKGIAEYIIAEKAAFRTRKVPLTDGYEWNMYDHIRKSFLYKHSKFATGADDNTRPFKNIILPVIRVAYRSEGFDVKDIVPFVNERKNYYKSFLIKKYHPKWARKYSIDTFIDELVESYVDYGLALVKNVNDKRPEVVPLQRLAFCDMTDILSGPLCEMHPMSPDQVSEYRGKWYDEAIDMAIQLSKNEKPIISDGDLKAETPGQYMEIYELHGTLPETWLNVDNGEKKQGDEGYVPPEYTNDTKYIPQMHIGMFYTGEDKKKKWLCLYKGREMEPIYKAKKRDPIYGRACGLGGIEELFEPQTWTNYSEIQIKEMLDIATMVLIKTTDEKFASRNNVNDIEKGEIVYIEEGKDAEQLSLSPNKALFDQKVNDWEQRAMLIGSASEGSLGKNPSSGTPFALQDLIVQEGYGAHEYRQGQLATFVGELYRDWILGWLVDEMNQGETFLDELDLDELQYVADRVITNEVNESIKTKMLKKGFAAEVMSLEERDLLKQVLRQEFMRGGTKRFLEILKDELKEIPIDVETNIAGKQKDLADMAVKLTNIFRAIIANPNILRDKGMADLFNQIIEASGFSPVDFSSLTEAPATETSAQPGSQSAIPTPVSTSPDGVALPSKN